MAECLGKLTGVSISGRGHAVIQETKLGRKCSVCTSRDSKAIDNLLVQGNSLTSISASFGASVSALSRHANSHLSKALRSGSLDTSAAPARVLTRLIDLADSARETRLVARQTGTTAVEIRATDAEAKILFALLGHLGIDETEVVALIRDGGTLARAVASFVARSEAGTDLLNEIEKYEFRDESFVPALAALTHTTT